MDVESFISNYPSLDDDLLQQKLYNKTEFEVLDPSNKRVDIVTNNVYGIKTPQKEVYFNFQRNLGRLLSPYTPYSRMLLFYDVGVGKTCTAILAHELIKMIERQDFRETIVITSGPSLEQNFKEQFIRKCPGIIKEFTFDKFVDELKIKQEIRKHFRFRKYGEFASFINGIEKSKTNRKAKSDEFIKRTFSNRIFILDEGHVLKNKGPRYTALQRVFDVAENLTILILTGTPITEQPVEAVNLINLLKPADQRMQIGDSAFIKKYYDYLEFREDTAEELINFYKGYVTYLKQTEDIPVSEFMENPDHLSEFTQFKTYNVEMKKFQEGIYSKSLKDKKITIKNTANPLETIFQEQKEFVSKEGGAFDHLALSSSIFVYPDGTYGSEGAKKNLKNKDKKTGTRKKIAFKDPQMEKEIVDNLSKYSAVFYQALEIIKEEDTRVFYVYFDILDNLDLFSIFLEKYLKFKYWDGKSSRFVCDTPKYIKITQEQTSSKQQLQKVLDEIGSERNAAGKCIRVVLGSPVSGIGLTIPTATRVMIIGSQVSPENIIQIPARINRPGSLKWLIKQGLPTDSATYLFAAISKSGEKSIDLHIYTLAQNKILLNTPQYKLLKQADPFCVTSYKRNVTSSRDNYQCSFAVDHTGKKIWSYPREKDETTDLLYWKEEEIAQLRLEMLNKIAEFGFVSVENFLENHNPMIVYRTVKEMSKERLEVNGLPVFIKGDLLFIDQTISGDPNSMFYVKTQTFPTDVTLYDVMSKRFMETDKPTLNKIINGENIEANFKKLTKYSQNYLWEESYKRQDCQAMKKVAKLKPVYEIDEEIYNVVWAEPLHYERSNVLVPIDDPMQIRKLVNDEWVYVGTRNLGELYPPVGNEDPNDLKRRKAKINLYKQQYKDLVKKINQSVSKEIKDFGQDNEFGFYGFIDPKTNKFKIVILGGKNRGKVCSPSFKKDEHMRFFKELGILDKIYNGTYEPLSRITESLDKEMTDKEIKNNLITIKKFEPPDDFSREDIITSIAILLPGGIPENERCAILQKEFKNNGILKE